MSLKDQMTELGALAKAASRSLALLSTDEKNQCLLAMAEALEAQFCLEQSMLISEPTSSQQTEVQVALLKTSQEEV